jgi:hypothetical protein
MKVEFDLHFKSEEFREIYFRNHQGSYLLSPATKQTAIILAIIGAILLVVLLIDAVQNISVLTITISIAFGISLLLYLNAAFKLWKWKREVAVFLKRESAYSSYRIILTNESFNLTQDDTEHIEKWSNIKTADITPDYVILNGVQDYLIPQKSIGKDQFDIFRKVVSEKLST